MRREFLMLIFALCTLCLFGEDELTKSIDFSERVSVVQQEEDAWCVYACLKAVDGMDQCDYCTWFINDYLLEDTCQNVYGTSYVSDDEYRSALHNLVIGEDNVCDNTSKYGIFGILGTDLEDFLCNVLSYTKYDTSTFIEQLKDIDKEMTAPPFLIFDETGYTGYGHCTVLRSSVLYDNNWSHPASKITIMDPAVGQSVDIDYNELMKASVVFGEY